LLATALHALTHLFAMTGQIHIVLNAALKSLVRETLASKVGIDEDIRALGIVGAVYAVGIVGAFDALDE
jgi:hypothetical protein